MIAKENSTPPPPSSRAEPEKPVTCLIYGRKMVQSAGGAERVVCWLANALAQRGLRVIFLADARGGRPFYPLDANVVFKNLPVPKRLALLHPLSSFLFASRFGRWILERVPWLDDRRLRSDALCAEMRRVCADVVVLSGLSELIEFTYRQPVGIPVIQMLHGPPDVFFQKKRKHKRILQTAGLAHVRLLQVLIPEFVGQAERFYRGPVTVIPNAVPMAGARSPVRPSGARKIVYLARLEPGKQQGLLIQAFARLAPRFPGWSVHLYGAGKPGHVRELKTMIRRLGMDGRIFLMGVTQEVPSVLLQADVCAFPSASEGFGLGLAEAMSVGLPCIGVRDAGGVRFLLKDGQAGIVTANTVDAFAAGLERLMADPALRGRLGEAGWNAVAEFAPAKIAALWENAVRRVLQSV